MASSEQTASMTNGLYNGLKFVALVLLPAIGALYFGLAQIWGLPNAEQVVGSITVIDTALGLLLRGSSSSYYKSGSNFDGEANVVPEDGGHKVVLAADRTLEDIVDDPGKHSVEFKINRTEERQTS